MKTVIIILNINDQELIRFSIAKAHICLIIIINVNGMRRRLECIDDNQSYGKC